MSAGRLPAAAFTTVSTASTASTADDEHTPAAQNPLADPDQITTQLGSGDSCYLSLLGDLPRLLQPLPAEHVHTELPRSAHAIPARLRRQRGVPMSGRPRTAYPSVQAGAGVRGVQDETEVSSGGRRSAASRRSSRCRPHACWLCIRASCGASELGTQHTLRT